MKLLANSAGVGEVSAAGVSTENTGISDIEGIAGCSFTFTSPRSTAGAETTSAFGLGDRTNLGFFAAGSFLLPNKPANGTPAAKFAAPGIGVC